MSMTIEQTFDGLNDIRKAMAALTDQDVLVGIPEDKAAREAAGDTGISNAYLGYIHEHGVPEKNIPARPFLTPGIQKVQPEIAAALKDAAQKALGGNGGAVAATLNKVGLLAQNSVRATFVDNDWPALSDKTLDARPLKKNDDGQAMTNKKGDKLYGKSRRERGRINPLINTGQLRKAITYVIRKR